MANVKISIHIRNLEARKNGIKSWIIAEEDKKIAKEETSKTDAKTDDKKKTVKVKKTTKAKKKNNKTTAKTKKLK